MSTATSQPKKSPLLTSHCNVKCYKEGDPKIPGSMCRSLTPNRNIRNTGSGFASMENKKSTIVLRLFEPCCIFVNSPAWSSMYGSVYRMNMRKGKENGNIFWEMWTWSEFFIFRWSCSRIPFPKSSNSVSFTEYILERCSIVVCFKLLT